MCLVSVLNLIGISLIWFVTMCLYVGRCISAIMRREY